MPPTGAKRKTYRQKALETLSQSEERTDRFPYEIDSQSPHKLGHAAKIPTPPETLVKVRCKCGVDQWITMASFSKKGRHPGNFCFICGGKREALQSI